MTLQLGRMSLRAPDLIGLLAALLVVIGSIGPWVRTVGEFFVGNEIEVTYAYGIKDDNGQVGIVLGILVGVIVLWRLLSRRSTTASTIGLAVGHSAPRGSRSGGGVQLVGSAVRHGRIPGRQVFYV